MKKNKKPLLALILLIIIGTIGVTIAYYTDIFEFPNLFKSKPYGTTSIETFTSPNNWTPGTVTPKSVVTTNKGDIDVAVRVSYTENWISKDGTSLPLTKQWISDTRSSTNDEYIKAAIIEFDNKSDWIKDGDYYYYNKKLSKGESTKSFIKSVKYNEYMESVANCTTSSDGKTQSCTAVDNEYQGGTYTLNVKIETIQFNAYKDAWNTDVEIGSTHSISEPNSFATDDWNVIANAVRSGNTSKYHVGDTKEVDLGDLGTHTVRIANMSTPEECSSEGFSQTACGFVVEFSDIVVTRSLQFYLGNSIVREGYGTNTNGGYKYTSIRGYLNYCLYDKLPEELRNSIIDTYTVSSTSTVDNSITNDKLYLLAAKEIYGDYNDSNFPDNASNLERQLDYYKAQGVNGMQSVVNSVAIKKYNSQKENWWLRSSKSNDLYLSIYTGGNLEDWYPALNDDGISPAFRIG